MLPYRKEFTMIKDYIVELCAAIDLIKDENNDVIRNMKINELRKLYHAYSCDEREEINDVLKSALTPIDFENLYELSFLLNILNADFILQLLIDMLQAADLDLYKLCTIELQVSVRLRTMDYGLRRNLHDIIIKKMKEIEFQSYSYIPVDQRDRDTIIIFTEQLIYSSEHPVKHAPSKNVLDYCAFLIEKLDKKVYLVVMPSVNALTDAEWFDLYSVYYVNDINGITSLSYQGVNIIIYQLPFERNNDQKMQELIQFVYNTKPMFVYSLGICSPIPDLISEFITVVSDNMGTFYSVSNAQILLKYGLNRALPSEKIIKDRNQTVFFMEPRMDLPAVDCYSSREEFGISQEKFVIVLVGTRLDREIDDQYIQFLEKLANMESRIFYVVIGNMEGYSCFFEGLEKEKKSLLLKKRADLDSVLGAMDLYLNPPRQGGGISALMALNVGVPVVTLDGCDVAFNVGSDFICQDEEEIVSTIMKYIHSDEYYKEQSNKARNRIKEISDLDSYREETINKIYHFIDCGEKKHD